MKPPVLSAAAAFALGGALAVAAPALRRDSATTSAAKSFLAALRPEQAKKATYAFDSDERFNWHYVPKERNGLPFKEMTPEQTRAALGLIRTGVSADGVKRLETLRAMENVLKEIEQGRGPTRDPDLYFVTVFGDPSDKGAWGWRYEGHHVSLQWVVKDGRVIADSPQFLGANPAEVREGPMKGTRLLSQEEDLGFALIKSLDAGQKQEAVIGNTAPNEIVTGNARRAAIEGDKGIAYARLTSAQKKLLEKIIAQHAALQAPDLARKRMDEVRRSKMDDVKFAWMGGMEPGVGHYYRVQGKTFLIEFDNTQNNANHIHAAWRDFNGDFGADLLAQHYRATPHRLADKR